MLWNIVYDFFVKYIFGGIASDGLRYTAYIGYTENDVGATYEIRSYPINLVSGRAVNMNFGSYISFIATIITIVAIVLFCVFIIKKIIAIIFRLFTGSSAF